VKENLFGRSRTRLAEAASAAGMPAYAGDQLADWLYAKGAASFDEMTNLSKSGRAALAEQYDICRSSPAKMTESADGTRKYLYTAGGGFVEAAWIPDRERSTLCVSVQVGCKMGCLFCMTGKQGFQSHLTSGEIVNQLASLPEREKVTNLVLMGMGEPMDNLDNVLEALDILTADWGYAMSPTRITVSTIGLVPAMRRFLAESKCHLAVSLHTPFEEERRRLMPIENVHPLHTVLDELREQRIGGQRRVSFEYILFHGVNDSPRHSKELARILAGIRCRVNLIPFHAIPGTPLAPSSRQTMERFQAELQGHGILTTIRQSRGQDIEAACGLLSTKELVKLRRGDDA
jgi:23S rRNA (adenine2503-C2)-methyltransferase